MSERERRLVLRVLNAWQERRGERWFPAAGDIAGAAFGEDWDSCCLLTLDRQEDPRFTHVGVAFGEGIGNGAALRVSTCRPDGFLALATGFFEQVLARRIPVSIGGPGRRDGNDILFRAILCPLSDDGERIDGLLGAANCRLVGGEPG